MGKFDGVLLASDFDDTLYHSERRISQRNKDAIDYFIREGGYFTVATGRAHSTFAPQLVREDFRINSPAILFNGSMVYDFAADRCLFETHLPERARDDIVRLLSVMPALGMAIYQYGDVYIHNPNEVTAIYAKHTGAALDASALDAIPLPWRKVVFQHDNPLLLDAQRYIGEHWGELYEAVFSNHYLLDLTRKGSTKGGMVLWVANLLGVAPAHIYCVGDNQNDIPMLEIASIGFAPANCSAEVRASGARIVSHCDEDCVAEVIGILDGIY